MAVMFTVDDGKVMWSIEFSAIPNLMLTQRSEVACSWQALCSQWNCGLEAKRQREREREGRNDKWTGRSNKETTHRYYPQFSCRLWFSVRWDWKLNQTRWLVALVVSIAKSVVHIGEGGAWPRRKSPFESLSRDNVRDERYLLERKERWWRRANAVVTKWEEQE